MATVDTQDFSKRGNSSELIVILHAYMSSPRKLSAVRKIVEDEFPNADIFIPNLPASWTSTVKPIDIIQNLLNRIDTLYNKNTQQDQGESMNAHFLLTALNPANKTFSM